MDTSEIYIKMCDCSEIQGEGVLPSRKYVNWFHDKKRKHNYESYGRADDDSLWLPRQDQIQEMMWSKYCFSFISELDFIIQKIKKDKVKARYYWERFLSWEQLWLAFYMQEKHQKTWDGESCS